MLPFKAVTPRSRSEGREQCTSVLASHNGLFKHLYTDFLELPRTIEGNFNRRLIMSSNFMRQNFS